MPMQNYIICTGQTSLILISRKTLEMPQENLSRVFVVNNLKGERKLIEIFAHRICFCSIANWIREDFNFSVTFQMLPGVCKSPHALWHKYSENCLVVVRSPLAAIVEDQVKWLR